MKLREIIYLDRVRVESYISQLSGSLTVQEATASANNDKTGTQFGADLSVVKFGVSEEAGAGTTRTKTAIPAHAILAILEKLLEEHGMLVDATKTLAAPGEIATFTGEATFESWGLLASLADSVQGVATLGAKIYSATRGQDDVKTIRENLSMLEKLIKKNRGHQAVVSEATSALASAINTPLSWLSVVDGKYINDVKDVVKLFFQDQNHIRLASHNKTFVGLLRREGLVGSTMEEMLFDYGSAPKVRFGALFYVAEFGRDETFDAEHIKARFEGLGGRSFSFSLVQEAIRKVGTVLLEAAEELRRPIGENASFVVPLAVYREISAPKAISTGKSQGGM